VQLVDQPMAMSLSRVQSVSIALAMGSKVQEAGPFNLRIESVSAFKDNNLADVGARDIAF
jgi:hypothetical protein